MSNICDPVNYSIPGFPVHHQLLGVCSNSCPLSWWCHPTISSSVVPFSSCLQSFPASGSFQFFISDGQSIGASASSSVLPMNIQGWFPLGHRKHPLPTTQETTLHMDITRWSIPKSDWLYSLQPKMEELYTVSKNKTGSWLWLRSWTPYYQIQT